MVELSTLCSRIQNIPAHYHPSIVDIFIKHRCVINETKRGINKGVRIILDFVPPDAINDVEKRLDFIENLESQNKEIMEARYEMNKYNPEHFSGIEEQVTLSLAQPSAQLHTQTSIHENQLPGHMLKRQIESLKINLTRTDFAHKASSNCFWCSLPISLFKQVCIPIRVTAGDNPCVHPYNHQSALPSNQDNPPKDKNNAALEYNVDGYGAFCRPECAAGYLMHERVDSSVKYERYMLLTQLYGNNSYSCIPPAVSPHYVLDKFLGTLTPVEYLAMTQGPVVYNTLNKPFTNIMPELHEKYIITKA